MNLDDLINQMPGWLVHPGQYALAASGLVLGAVLAVIVLAMIPRGHTEAGHGDRSKAALQSADYLTFVGALMATGVSFQGMWIIAGDRLHMHGPERGLLCGFMEVALVACALRARRNVREVGKEGLDGILVWVFAVLTGFFGASVGTGIGAMVRFCVPLVAAVMWQRGLSLLRRRVRPDVERSIAWRWTSERLAIWLGLAEPAERSTSEVARARRIARLIKVRIALAALEAKPTSPALAFVTFRGMRKAIAAARLRSQSIAAVEHLKLGVDPDVMEQISRTTAAVVNLPALTDPRAVARPAASKRPEGARGRTGTAPQPPTHVVSTQRTVSAADPDRDVVTERVEEPSADEVEALIADALQRTEGAPTADRARALLEVNPKFSYRQMAPYLGVTHAAIGQALRRAVTLQAEEA